MSKIHKELIKSTTTKKQTTQLKKWANDLIIFQGDIQIANRHMKTCSTLLIIRKRQIETIVRHHYHKEKK